MKKYLHWFVIFLLIWGVSAFARTKNNPIFDNVTINGILTVNGQIGKFRSLGSQPTIATCGVSASVTGTDNSMLLTMGSGTLSTCTVNFANAWTTAPHCVAFPQNATAAATGTTVARISAITTSVLTFTGSNLTSAAYNVLCW